MRLRYIGSGPYLNGIPATDHDQTDAEAIAVALASGLYMSDEVEAEPMANEPTTSTSRRRRETPVEDTAPVADEGAAPAAQSEE